MYVKYRDQIVELIKELGLPLTAALVGVDSGSFATILMSRGMELLYLVDEWKESAEMDDQNMHEYYDNQLLQVQNRMAIYDHRTEQYIILQGTSQDIAPHINDMSVSMVYIDKDNVQTDIEQWYPKLVQGSILAFNNYQEVQETVVLWAVDNNYSISDIVSIPEYGTNAGAYIIKH